MVFGFFFSISMKGMFRTSIKRNYRTGENVNSYSGESIKSVGGEQGVGVLNAIVRCSFKLYI